MLHLHASPDNTDCFLRPDCSAIKRRAFNLKIPASWHHGVWKTAAHTNFDWQTPYKQIASKDSNLFSSQAFFHPLLLFYPEDHKYLTEVWKSCYICGKVFWDFSDTVHILGKGSAISNSTQTLGWTICSAVLGNISLPFCFIQQSYMKSWDWQACCVSSDEGVRGSDVWKKPGEAAHLH